jgi:CheY-like chemotaxis protein
MTTQPPLPPRRDDPTAPRALTVLLVDPHDHARSALAAALGRLGHRALAASTCAAARDLAATHRPPPGGGGPRLVDLVIGDARLPDGDGVALVAELGPALGCAAAVAIGGGGEPPVRDGARRSADRPGVRHLPRPLTPEAVLALLDEVAR